MIGDCLNYKIAIQWLSSRPIGVPFARCVTTLGPYRKRDRIKTVSTKSVDALALDQQEDSRSMPLKVLARCSQTFYTQLSRNGGESCIAGTHSWKPLATAPHRGWINRSLLANASNMLTRGKSIQHRCALTRVRAFVARGFQDRKLQGRPKSSIRFFSQISSHCIQWKQISHQSSNRPRCL